MRILLTTPTYPPFNSGVGNAVRRQAEELTRRGHAITVATGGMARTSELGGDIRVERFAVDGAPTLRNPIRGDIEGYREFLRKTDADAVIMHAWQTWSTDLALEEVKPRGVRAYVYSHCISTNTWLSYRPLQSLAAYVLWRPYWWNLRRAMSGLTGIFFLADGGDARFDDLRLARRIGARVHVIPNAVEGAAPPAAARTQLIAVGSYTRAKGFDFVLRAYSRSSARNVWPLVMFGQEETPYLDELRKLAAELGLGREAVIFRSGVAGEDLLAEYARAKLVLFGSYTECQPLALLDAMATGTPFVSKNTGCIAQLAGGMPVSTPEQAAREIDKLLENDDEWAKASAAGVRAASADHSLERNCDRLLQVLMEDAAN